MAPRLRQVIESQEHRGDGTDDNPHRLIAQIHDTDGTFIMERDDWQAEQSASLKRNAYAAVNCAKRELQKTSPRIPLVEKLIHAAMLCLEGHSCELPREAE